MTKNKRITFIIPEEHHAKVKIAAAECGVTMQRYILQAIQMRFNLERNPPKEKND